ncbi:MAG: hypothetical protein JSW11_15960 [Candidatus Heimdallarchaeota archaeon]|nr:MAG: hypothetical protein JSW11_15960 [Candidatus Heimdallarchaeota archaeon]
MGTTLEKHFWFESEISCSKYQTSQEQIDTWFLGSLLHVKSPQKEFHRLSTLHNRITHEETKFDDRLQTNMRVASQLAEFFPFKWLLEITSVFRKTDSTLLGIKSLKDRVCSYLGFIELYLTFRGLTLLDSTLDEINHFFDLSINKNEVRTWKLKLLRIYPKLRKQWTQIRAQTHRSAFFSTVVLVMNDEMNLSNNYSKKEIFLIKQACLRIARKFISTPKARFIKKPEVWARAICVKAVREVLPDQSSFPFAHLAIKTQKVIENKRWQLDQVIQEF